MSAIAIIPAKGVSRRIPRKNVRNFHGRPIIAYSIDAAVESRLFDRIIVSTDDEVIARMAEGLGAESIMRPPELSSDRFGPLDVAAHAVRLTSVWPVPDFYCCILATAPMLQAGDLRRGLRELEKRPESSYSFGMGTEPPKDAGMWYWGRTQAFLDNVQLVNERTVMVPMPENRVCDINTEEDWLRAERMYGALHPAPCEHQYRMHTWDMPEERYFRCEKCGVALMT